MSDEIVVTRKCGCCELPKPLSDFYRDGTDGQGNIKYRRDCKECYKLTRHTERKNKKG